MALYGQPSTVFSHTYEALGPPLQQQAFTRRRKSVKSMPNRGQRSARSQRQSTLTQVGWISSPRNMGVTDISDDDSEYMERSHATKKRRKTTSKLAGRTENRPTDTQTVSSVPSKRARRSAHVGAAAISVFEDMTNAHALGESEMGTTTKSKVRGPEKREGDDHEPSKNLSYLPEIPDSSSQAIDSFGLETVAQRLSRVPSGTRLADSQAKHDRANKEAKECDLQEVSEASSTTSTVTILKQEQAIADTTRSPWPATALATPRRVHVLEIPSSQSPASIMLSPCKSERYYGLQRSPLHERNVNTLSPRTALGAKPRSPSLRNPDEAPVKPPKSAKRLSASQTKVDDNFHKPLMPAKKPSPPTLKRATTIADSQLDEADLNLESDLEAGEELANPDLAADENKLDQDYQQSEHCEILYDPVCSALDRDAARFLARTQTQGMALELHVSNSIADDEEDLLTKYDGEDAPSAGSSRPFVERQTIANIDDVIETTVPSSQKHERQIRPQHREGRKHSDEALEVISSSPPPQLPPSQISTVVPSQTSPTRASPRLNSPVNIQPVYDEVVDTSSPLPLPPWSSPETMRLGVEEVDKLGERNTDPDNQIHSLADFSLPPPPPMSSGKVIGRKKGGF